MERGESHFTKEGRGSQASMISYSIPATPG